MEFNKTEIDIIKATKDELIKQIDEVCASLPSDLIVFFSKSAILSGGAISSIHLGETPNDYDIYLKDEDSVKKFKELINSPEYMNMIQDVNEKYMDTLVDGKLVTANATTFKNGIQVITRSDCSGRLQFDFIHCMPWFDFHSQKLYISREQYNCIENKHLVKNPLYNLQISNKRISKYTDRGWRFRPEK